jgi:hypothetical protein
MEPNKTIKESLRYDFSDAEITQIARDQGQKMRDRTIIEEEKKRVAKQYAVRIETLDGEIDADTDKITSGYEMRMVECGVFYHTPILGKKTIVRLDSGKEVRVESMTEMECQAMLELEEGESDGDGEEEAEQPDESATPESVEADQPEAPAAEPDPDPEHPEPAKEMAGWPEAPESEEPKPATE